MPVSSLVLHLSPDAELRAQALEQLAVHPAVMVGESAQRLLAAALDTASEDENKSCWRWLNALPGVDFVEVLSVVFATEASSSPLPGGSSRSSTLKRSPAGA